MSGPMSGVCPYVRAYVRRMSLCPGLCQAYVPMSGSMSDVCPYVRVYVRRISLCPGLYQTYLPMSLSLGLCVGLCQAYLPMSGSITAGYASSKLIPARLACPDAIASGKSCTPGSPYVRRMSLSLGLCQAYPLGKNDLRQQTGNLYYPSILSGKLFTFHDMIQLLCYHVVISARIAMT